MTKNNLPLVDEIIEEQLTDSVELLRQLCAIPSVTDDRQASAQCAEFVAEILKSHGLETKQFDTGGNPIIYGEAAGKSDKTILFYLHYDVQSPEPVDSWTTPPFELTQRDNKLFARGAADDKGHIVSRLAALSTLQKAYGHFPCNVKFFIEGEEEAGSQHVESFIKKNRGLLAADGCVWEFGGVNLEGRPVQVLGMRGICYVDLKIQTASIDAHSGIGGSIFPNAAWRLAWALSSLKDKEERIRIPGFFDDVIAPTEEDLELLAQIPDEFARMKKMYGINGFLKGMSGLELRRASVFEPTCTICGLDSGYQGNGSKTVLPAEARAKVDFRLVPDQHPDDILNKLRDHLDREGFSDVEIIPQGSTKPARTDPSDPFVSLANQTAEIVYGQRPSVHPMTGGSGPNHPFIHILNLPVISSGVGYPGTAIHAPNEHIRLEDLKQGIRHIAYLLEAMGQE